MPKLPSLFKKLRFLILLEETLSFFKAASLANLILLLTVPILFDSSLASSCGVYSTPQAVLLDINNTLYYRGNYNKSRYCTDRKSNYAQMAIDSLLAHRGEPVFNQYALKAYGCSLPTCKK